MGQLRLLGEPPASDDHAALANLAFPQAGHTGFVAAAGLTGGQTIIGGTAAGEHLVLQSTASASRGRIRAQDDLQLMSNQLRDSADNIRLQLAAVSPHLTLHDDVRVDNHLALGDSPQPYTVLHVRKLLTGAGLNTWKLLDLGPSSSLVRANVYGVYSTPIINVEGGYTVSHIAGLYFVGYLGGSGNVTNLDAVYARVANQVYTGTIANAQGIRVPSPFFLGDNYPTVYRGLFVENYWSGGDGTAAYGIQVGDAVDPGMALPNRFALKLGDPSPGLLAGENAYAIKIDAVDASASGNRYALYYGDVGSPRTLIKHSGELVLAGLYGAVAPSLTQNGAIQPAYVGATARIYFFVNGLRYYVNATAQG